MRSPREPGPAPQVFECGWAARRAPDLHRLYGLCRSMHAWLRQDPRNVCVVHCADGRAASAVAVCSFLCFCRLFSTAEAAVYMFSMKRCPPGIWPSHKRYRAHRLGTRGEAWALGGGLGFAGPGA